MSNFSPTVLADNFVFLEGPRWHEGELWIADMWGHKVHRISPAGVVADVIEVRNDHLVSDSCPMGPY